MSPPGSDVVAPAAPHESPLHHDPRAGGDRPTTLRRSEPDVCPELPVEAQQLLRARGLACALDGVQNRRAGHHAGDDLSRPNGARHRRSGRRAASGAEVSRGEVRRSVRQMRSPAERRDAQSRRQAVGRIAAGRPAAPAAVRASPRVFGRADPPAWAPLGDVPAERVAAAYFHIGRRRQQVRSSPCWARPSRISPLAWS